MKLHLVLAAAAVLLGAPLSSQPAPPDQLIAAQAEKMAVFDWMRGEWRGTAVRRGPEGEVTMIQTERVGPMLDGSLLVVEGRGFDAESGEEEFNAFGTIHYDMDKGEYRLRSSAMGRSGDFLVQPVEGGFDWFIEQGPIKIRYEARNIDGRWVETGFVKMPGREEEFQMLRMELDRIGDSDWPAAGAVGVEP